MPTTAAIPETILVVEDDADALALYEEILTRRNYHVLKAATGREALRLAEKIIPDLVLLDLILPDMSGEEVCQQLRLTPSGALVPIVAISGQMGREEMLDLLSRGADDFLTKPVAPPELLARIESHLRARRFGSRYVRTFTSLSVPLAVLDAEGLCQEANPALADALGEAPESLTGKSIAPYLDESVRKQFERLVAEAVSSGQPGALAKCSLVGRAGERAVHEVKIRRLQGLVPEVMVEFICDGHWGELAAQLQQTREFLAAVVQHSGYPMIAAQQDGSIIVFNEAAERLSGYKLEEVVGELKVGDFYAPGVLEDLRRRLESENYGGRGRLEPCVNAIIAKGGEEIPVMISASVLYDRSGQELAWMAILDDLRERIRIEKDLEAAREMRISEARKSAATAVAGAASHELAQPLMATFGKIHQLEDAVAGNDKAAQLVASLSEEVQRMQQILSDLGKVQDFRQRRYAGDTSILDMKSEEKD
ncbi:MAG: PAS domain S-box protein [Chrysiogenetes bacterium]|nr:PAS domain S-box protein [Chrysiogenetes bacterium]